MGNIERFLDVCKLNLSTRAFTILSIRIHAYGTNRIFAEALPHIFSYSEISKTPGCGANTAHEILNMLKIESVKKELDRIVFYSVTKEDMNPSTHSRQYGQCKDCQWWEDTSKDDIEFFDCCSVCHMMTFKGCDTQNAFVPVAETSLIKYVYLDFPNESNEKEEEHLVKIQSCSDIKSDNRAKIFTPRFFGCMMFEQRRD